MVYINNYEANSQFRSFYYNIDDHFSLLADYVKHMNQFINFTENKIGKDLEIYSSDFFEYYNADAYGETFRGSFIITVSSVSEIYIKDYVMIWQKLMGDKTFNESFQFGIIDFLKTTDKKIIQLGIDYSKSQVPDFQGLLAIRNALVHSNGTFEYVKKYTPQILQFSRKYPSIIVDNEQIFTTQEFCTDALNIARKFFFYLLKKTIQKFPNYNVDKPLFDDN